MPSKKILYKKDEKHPGRWLKELLAVVWGLWTHTSSNTTISPYYLVYGLEAILPANIAFRRPQVENFNEEQSVTARQEDMDCLKEERLVTCVHTTKYLEGLWRYYNRNIHERSFMVGDLVLHKKQKTDGLHKLSSHWEGPFIIKKVTQPGSYRHCDSEGIDVPNSWYVDVLKHFYP